MYIISTVNPQTKTAQDLPIIVLSCANRQKFVQRPNTYAELVALAEDRYHLKDQSSDTQTRLIFTTSTLDICQGKDIEIDENAYSLLSPVLDEVKVKRVKVTEGHGTGAHLAAETTHVPMTPPMDEDPVQGDNTPVPSTARAGPSRAASKRPMVDERAEPATHEYPPSSSKTSRFKPNRVDLNVDEVAATFTTTRTTTFKEPAQPQPPPRTRGRSASPEKPILSTPASRRGAGKKAAVLPTPAPLEFEEEEEIVEIPHPQVQAQDPVVENGHTSSRTRGNRGIKAENGGSSDGTATPRRTPRTPHAPRAVPKPSSSTSDERYTVHITGPDQEADFKTRGKHTVKKVLAGACRSWELDYERARLLLIVEDNGEEERFICEPELTMADCGIHPGSRLEIEVDDEVQDESELDDEDDVKDDLLDFD